MRVLPRRFRGLLFVHQLRNAFADGELRFPGVLADLVDCASTGINKLTESADPDQQAGPRWRESVGVRGPPGTRVAKWPQRRIIFSGASPATPKRRVDATLIRRYRAGRRQEQERHQGWPVAQADDR